MIAVVHQDITLNLPAGKLSFELSFPGLDTDAIKQSFAFTNNFPNTPVNDKAFKCGRLLSIPDKIREIAVDVYMGGNFWRKAKIIFSDMGTDGYRGSIVLDEMFVDQVDRSLKEVDFGPAIPIGDTPEERVDYAKTVSLIQGYKNPDNPVTFFPVYNPWFYGGGLEGEDAFGQGENLDFYGVINYFQFLSPAPASKTFLHNVIPPDDSPMNMFCLVPFIYHHCLIEHILKPYNINIAGSFWTDEECRTAVLHNNTPLDYKRPRRYVKASLNTVNTYLSAFTTVDLNIGLPETQDNDSRLNLSTNKYETGNIGFYKITIQANVKGFEYSTLTPGNYPGQVQIKVVGIGGYNVTHALAPYFIATAGGADIFFESIFEIPLGHQDADVYLEAKCLDVDGGVGFNSGFVTIENFRASQLNEYSPEINLKNHVPNKPITTYFNELRKLFGLTFLFDPITRELNIDFVKDYLGDTKQPVREIATSPKINTRLRERTSLLYKWDWNSSSDDLTEGNFKGLDGLRFRGFGFTAADPVNGDYIIRPDVAQVHVYKDGSFEYYSDYFPDQKYGTEKNIKEVTLSMTPMLMHWGYFGGNRLVMPKIKQEAHSPAFNLDNPDIGLKTCFYRGHIDGIDDTSGRLVPSGSSMTYGMHNNVIGNTCLSLVDVISLGVYNQYLKTLIDLMLYSDLVIFRGKLTASDIISFNWKRKLMIEGTRLIAIKLSFETDADGLTETEIEAYTDYSGYNGFS